MTTVDLSTVGKQGTGSSGLVQVNDYGTVDGLNFTITQHVEPADSTANPRTPFVNGTTGGYTQYSAGPRGDTGETLGYFQVRLVSNRALSSLVWAARGIADTSTEEIFSISNGGTASGLGSASTGTVTWTNLPENTYEVSFLVVSSSDNNNSGYGRLDTGNAVLHTGGGDDNPDTIIIPGAVDLTGTASRPGLYEVTVDVTDSNGIVGPVPVRFEVSATNPPVVTSPGNQTDDIGDVINLTTFTATNPNSHTLVYSAVNLPSGLSIDEDTGVITGTLTKTNEYIVELAVTDEWGQCEIAIISWTVSGEDEEFNLENLTGPVTLGRETGTGEVEEMDPAKTRRTNQLYSKTEIDEKDAGTLVTIRGGILEDYDTLEKLRSYLRGLIDLIEGGGGDVDLSAIYNILGLGVNDTQMPAIGAISAGSVADQLEDLEARIPDDTAALPDMPGETMLVRSLTTTGPPSNKTYSEIRTILSLYTQAQITSFLANKFDDSKGDNLVNLTGRPVNSTNLGTAVTSSRVSDNQDIVEMFNAILGLIDDLYNNGGGGGGSLTLDGQRIAANLGSSTATASGATYGQIRSALNVYQQSETYSQSEVDSEISTAKNDIIGGAPSNLNTLNELAAAIGDDASYSSTVTTALNGKAAATTVNSLVSLSGASSGASNLGTFTGSTISNNRNNKQALQDLETALENVKGGGLTVPTWVQQSLNSAHSSRNWQVAINCYVRRGASGDVCFLSGQIWRTTGSGGSNVLLENTNIFTSAIDSDLRPTMDFRFSILGAGSSTTRNRTGQLIIQTDGHFHFRGDQSQSTYIWDLYGSWPVGGGVIA